MILRSRGVDVHDYGAKYIALSHMRPSPEEEMAENENDDMQAAANMVKTHPGEFEFELVEGDGETFDWGYNIKSCAICHVFGQHDATDLVPYMCAYDDVASEQGDMGLHRKGTIATGAIHCDFRYKQGRKTHHLAELHPDKIRLVTR